MSDILDKAICLALNKMWQPIAWRTVRQTIVSLCPNCGEEPQVFALDIELDADGKLVSAIPTKWDDWIYLPVRASDLAIGTKNRPVRAPLVVVAAAYGQNAYKSPPLTSNAILERDGNQCQYSGEVLPRSQLNIDHVIPRDRGGKDTWENMVACRKDINFNKSNRLNSEAGLRLIRPPTKPKAVPVSFLMRNPKHDFHVPFLTSR